MALGRAKATAWPDAAARGLTWGRATARAPPRSFVSARNVESGCKEQVHPPPWPRPISRRSRSFAMPPARWQLPAKTWPQPSASSCTCAASQLSACLRARTQRPPRCGLRAAAFLRSTRSRSARSAISGSSVTRTSGIETPRRLDRTAMLSSSKSIWTAAATPFQTRLAATSARPRRRCTRVHRRSTCTPVLR